MIYVALRTGFVGHAVKVNGITQLEVTKDIRKAMPFTTPDEAEAMMKANREHRQYAVLSTCVA